MFQRKLIVNLCLMQARIVALNAHYFLKNGGHFVISIKVNFSLSPTFNFHTVVLDRVIVLFHFPPTLIYRDFEAETLTKRFLVYHINAG